MVRSVFAHGSIANIMTWPRCIIVPAYNTTYPINIWSSRSEIYMNIFYQSNILRSTGELGYDGPLYDGFLHMTDQCLVPVRCISSICHVYTTDFAYDGPIFLVSLSPSYPSSPVFHRKLFFPLGLTIPLQKTFSICTETGLVKSCQTLRALHIKMDYRTQNMQYPCFFICYLSHFQLHVCFQATNTRGS